MLRVVDTFVTIILNIRCWSWARLCCLWKLPGLFSRGQPVHSRTPHGGSAEKSGLQDVKR